MAQSETNKARSFSNVYYKRYHKASYYMMLIICFAWIMSELFFYIQKEKKLTNYNNSIKTAYIKKDIKTIVTKINNINEKYDYILKERIKVKTEIAQSIASKISLHNYSQEVFKNKLLNKINETIPGNYIIANTEGQTIYYKNGINRSKHNIEQELISIKNNNNFFIEYNSTIKDIKTYSYVNKINYKNWYINFYETEKVKNRTKNIEDELRIFLDNNFSNKSCFIYTKNGVCVYHSQLKDRINKHYLNFPDSLVRNCVKKMLFKSRLSKLAKLESNCIDNNNFKTITYMENIYNCNWIVGASFQEKNKNLIQSSIHKNKKQLINKIAVIFAFFLMFAYINKILLTQIKNSFVDKIKNLKKFFSKNTIQSYDTIKNELEFIEFIEIANKINSAIDKRLTREHRLKKATEKAIESDLLKSSFLANMSHEIRTPLNSIMGFSNLLESEDFSKKEKAEFCANIKHSGELLLYLINDIIDISKIESGSMKIEFNRTNISSILHELETTFAIIKEKRDKQHIKIIIQNKLNKSTISSDAIRLKQILSNLIDNAIKFTDKGSVSIIAEHIDNDDILFRVIDTGIGINTKAQEYIFDRFYQVETSKNRKFSGTGLGLAISYKLCNLLGGKIWVESTPMQGSCFYLHIPYIPVADKLKLERTDIIIFD